MYVEVENDQYHYIQNLHIVIEIESEELFLILDNPKHFISFLYFVFKMLKFCVILLCI